MQRLTSVLWSSDDRYIFSASDEMNIRIWKARASEKLGVVREREKMALRVNDKLKEKFLHHPEVKRIDRHRHVPKHIYNGRKEIRTSQQALKRKESNRRAHSKPGSVPYVPERSKTIIAEKEWWVLWCFVFGCFHIWKRSEKTFYYRRHLASL